MKELNASSGEISPYIFGLFSSKVRVHAFRAMLLQFDTNADHLYSTCPWSTCFSVSQIIRTSQMRDQPQTSCEKTKLDCISFDNFQELEDVK